VRPAGALYLVPRLDPDVYHVEDDQKLVLDLLREQNLLVVQGTGFTWPSPDHLRLVTLPRVDDLREAIGRLAVFLSTRR
jgi:alanine-synthesizing transaminase